jgi:hypothetical protein
MSLIKLGIVLVFCAALGADSNKPSADYFYYSDYGAVLEIYVNDDGMVDYANLKENRKAMDRYVDSISELHVEQFKNWTESEKIAFWVNAYNGLTLRVIIDNYPIKSGFLRSLVYPENSIRQIDGVWDEITFDVMGSDVTLEHIEHQILRKKFNEPRVHMALVCAARGCPLLRQEPYVGYKLNEQLDDQARRFLNDSSKFRIDRSEDTVFLSPIFKWFGGDFREAFGGGENIAGHGDKVSGVLRFVVQYLENAEKTYVGAGNFEIEYLTYDWSLNEQK